MVQRSVGGFLGRGSCGVASVHSWLIHDSSGLIMLIASQICHSEYFPKKYFHDLFIHLPISLAFHVIYVKSVFLFRREL